MFHYVIFNIHGVFIDNNSAVPEVHLKITSKIPGIHSLVTDLYHHGVTSSSISVFVCEKIEKAIRELGSNAQDGLMITDSFNGLLAAKSAGIPVVGFADPNAEKQDLSNACIILEGFEEIDYSFLFHIYCRTHNLPLTIAETKRLKIRELMPEDMEEVFKIYQDKETMAGLNIGPCGSLESEIEKQKAYIKNIYHFYGYGIWGVFERSSGKCIGRCGIESKIIDKQAELELSYLLDRHYWSQGYGIECTLAVIRYAKEQLHAQRIAAVIDKQNTRSIRLAKRLGFLMEKDLSFQNHNFCLYTLNMTED